MTRLFGPIPLEPQGSLEAACCLSFVPLCMLCRALTASGGPAQRLLQSAHIMFEVHPTLPAMAAPAMHIAQASERIKTAACLKV